MPALLDVRDLSIEFATAQGRSQPSATSASTSMRAKSSAWWASPAPVNLSPPAVVSQISHRIGVMYAGSMVEMGTAPDVFRNPAHSYTRGLLNSVPTLRSDRAKPLQTIEGTVPAIAALPPGCAFEPRCDLRVPACSTALPPLLEVAPGHFARCPITAPEAR